MNYPKAKYETVMCCPECGFNNGVSNEGNDMPNQYDLIKKEDDNGQEYYECFCDCKFVE